MKIEVTRDVVSDLWPLYRCGEAAAETRKVVETFLEGDAAFAATLQASEASSRLVPALRLSPDAERQLLEAARARARTKLLIIGMAVGTTALLLLTSLGGALYFMAQRM